MACDVLNIHGSNRDAGDASTNDIKATMPVLVALCWEVPMKNPEAASATSIST